jgi:S1-C subfamily serine protease
MNKRWLWIVLGVIAFCVILFGGVVTGAGLTYLILHANPVQAAREMIIETVNPPEDGYEAGVLVLHVEQESPAAEAGIQRGDIILAVDGQDVNTILEVMHAIVDKSAGDDVVLDVQHCEATQEVTVRLDERNGHVYLGLQMNRSPVAGTWPLERGSTIVQAEKPVFIITQVIPGSPADQAGLTTGDMIIAVDGEEFQEDDNLSDIVHSYQPGDDITLSIKDPETEKPHQVTVTLGENPDDLNQAFLGIYFTLGPAAQGFNSQGEQFHNFGIPDFDGESPPLPDTLPKLIPQFRNFPDLPQDVKQAIVISSVVTDSPADQAGLKSGDVITAINNESVTDPTSFVETVQSFDPGEEISLTIYRSGESESLEIEIVLGDHPDNEDQVYLGVTIGGFLYFGDGKPFHFDFQFPWQEHSPRKDMGEPGQGEGA